MVANGMPKEIQKQIAGTYCILFVKFLESLEQMSGTVLKARVVLINPSPQILDEQTGFASDFCQLRKKVDVVLLQSAPLRHLPCGTQKSLKDSRTGFQSACGRISDVQPPEFRNSPYDVLPRFNPPCSFQLLFQRGRG